MIDRQFPVEVRGYPPTLYVGACDFGGPHVSIERIDGGLVVLTLGEARALHDVLYRAIEELEKHERRAP